MTMLVKLSVTSLVAKAAMSAHGWEHTQAYCVVIAMQKARRRCMKQARQHPISQSPHDNNYDMLMQMIQNDDQFKLTLGYGTKCLSYSVEIREATAGLD